VVAAPTAFAMGQRTIAISGMSFTNRRSPTHGSMSQTRVATAVTTRDASKARRIGVPASPPDRRFQSVMGTALAGLAGTPYITKYDFVR
jgi:hypothetical protein